MYDRMWIPHCLVLFRFLGGGCFPAWAGRGHPACPQAFGDFCGLPENRFRLQETEKVFEKEK